MRPLSVELNNKIMLLAPKHHVSSLAPDSFERLNRHIGRLVVWFGASEDTIYGNASVNWAFRAWHDSLHLKLGAPFTFEGEKLVALEQARLVDNPRLGDIIMAEVVGQAEHLEKHGEFPANQRAFIEAYLKKVA